MRSSPFHVRRLERGMSLVEVVVASALMLVVFGGILSGFHYATALMANTRAESGALALANEYLEYLHALPYASVGTSGGIPSGILPQNQTIVLNGITYNRRILVQYVDAPDDGSGVSDSNGILADFKRAKVELSWTIKGIPRSLALVTNLVPQGIETTAGGGTLVVNVFDAATLPVAGAGVRVVNASTSPAIDVTSYTNVDGTVMFPGAPAASGYRITATKAGYSTDQTYTASTTNPNPNPPHISVVASVVSTMNFAIDTLSSLSFRMVAPPSETSAQDSFNDTSQVAASSSVVVGSGEVVLAGTPGAYSALGTLQAATTSPTNLSAWVRAEWSDITADPQVEVLYHVYAFDASGTPQLVPDGDLAGNAAGFSAGPISLSGLSVTSYPSLALGATLRSFNGLVTPQILEWSIVYEVANVAIPNIPIALAGTKVIGTDGVGQPVLKYAQTQTGNASGEIHIASLEWGQYGVTMDGASTGYDISDACPTLPLSISPGTTSTTTLVLAPHTAHSLRVYVKSTTGIPLEGAAVRLTRSGVDQTVTTSACGHAFFSGLSSANDFVVDTTRSGYTASSVTDVDVTGTTFLVVTLL